MTHNPGFKIEPTISQLRRAEAAFIETHDAYLKDPSDRRTEEMRWAHTRLTIARHFYDGLVAALPPVKRAGAAHPVKRGNNAIKQLRLAEFNPEEQAALRLAVTDQTAAVEQIDAIITAGRASTRNLRIIHAYLIDPDARGRFRRWLIDEIAAARAGAPDPAEDDHGDDAVVVAAQVPVPRSPVANATEAPIAQQQTR